MEKAHQFVRLSEEELFSTAGGGLFDDLLDGLIGGRSNSSVDYTGLTTFMGASYQATNKGFADSQAAIGRGTEEFLSNLRFPTS